MHFKGIPIITISCFFLSTNANDDDNYDNNRTKATVSIDNNVVVSSEFLTENNVGWQQLHEMENVEVIN